MGLNGLKWAKETFTREKYVESFVRVINRLKIGSVGNE